MRNLTSLFALLGLMCATGCTAGHEPGQTVGVWENGHRRNVAASTFDEQACLKKGFYKTRDQHGDVLYVRIPDTDLPKDITFITGTETGKERSFGGLGGQFTGRMPFFVPPAAP